MIVYCIGKMNSVVAIVINIARAIIPIVSA